MFSPISEGIQDLHNYIIIFISIISVFVFFILIKSIYQFWLDQIYNLNYITIIIRFMCFKLLFKTHSTTIEILWTVVPSFVLIWIVIPSFSLLYAIDEIKYPTKILIKVIGNQWYWHYQYYKTFDNLTEQFFFKKTSSKFFEEHIKNKFDYEKDEKKIITYKEITKSAISTYFEAQNLLKFKTFDSYIISEEELSKEKKSLRLLAVDNNLRLPAITNITLIVTSNDVLHSWALPSHGIKIDTVPGRLSQTELYSKVTGTFFGQCSEICGVNHGFIPIAVEFIILNDFISYIYNIKEKNWTILTELIELAYLAILNKPLWLLKEEEEKKLQTLEILFCLIEGQNDAEIFTRCMFKENKTKEEFIKKILENKTKQAKIKENATEQNFVKKIINHHTKIKEAEEFTNNTEIDNEECADIIEKFKLIVSKPINKQPKIETIAKPEIIDKNQLTNSNFPIYERNKLRHENIPWFNDKNIPWNKECEIYIPSFNDKEYSKEWSELRHHSKKKK